MVGYYGDVFSRMMFLGRLALRKALRLPRSYFEEYERKLGPLRSHLRGCIIDDEEMARAISDPGTGLSDDWLGGI